MQNFTLGKKGISMLFFAFFLLIGSSPTFGQTCPTVNSTPPSFCYLDDINDLTEDTGGNSDVVWYRDEAMTQPIPSNEFLEDNKTYYAGNAEGDCTTPTPVTVTVGTIPAPVSQYGTVYSPYLESETSKRYIEDLTAAINTTTEGEEIIVYTTEYGTVSYVESDELTAGQSYFVGQTSTATCEFSFRIAIRYSPDVAPAPIAQSPQVFCEGATVADLEATPIEDTQAFRWYSTDTSNPALDENELLRSGTYYVSQIVNDEGLPSPPVESEARTAVTVNLTPPQDLGGPYTGTICEDEVQATFPSEDEIRKYYIALIGNVVPDPNSGTLSPNAAQLAQMYQNDADGLGDFTTTYTYGTGDCASSVDITVSIIPREDAEAGTIEDITVPCGSSDIVVLDDTILSDDATTGGTFSGTGVNSDGNFDPSTVDPGTYEITYFVDDSADCVTAGTSDFTTFDIIVQGSEFGEPIVKEMCIIEAQALLSNPTEAEAFFNNILAENGITNFDGTFDPDENVVGTAIFTYINSEPTEPETFNTTYTVTTDCGEESVDITLTINNTEEPNAGEINAAPVCSSATLFDLNSLLDVNNNPGGTFSNGDGEIENGLFDVSQTGSYPITYTVTENPENCTAGEPDSTEFTLTVNEGIVAESPEAVIVCETDVPALFPSVDEIRKFYIAIAQQAGFPTNGTLNPNGTQLADIYQADEDGLGDFSTTYTFGDGDCKTSVELTVEIVPVKDANPGTIKDITVPCENSDIVILDNSILSDDATTGGTFSGTGVNSDGNFDPSTVDPGTYEITYFVDDSADCVTTGTSDFTTFDITVGETGNSVGTPIEPELCITEAVALLVDPTAAITYFNDLVADLDPALDGDFTVEPAILGAQILGYVNDPTTPSQTFSTNYTYASTCGNVSTDISLTINNTTPADAGEIADFSLCQNDENFDLFTKLTDDNPKGGTFSDDSGVIENGLFDISATGVYTITYTVSEDDLETCLSESDSTEFDLTVTENTIVIGNSNTGIVCEADVQTLFPSVDEIRKYLISLLDPGVSKTAGTFSPTAAQLAQMYQDDEDGFGDFKTNYTIVDGTCSSSVELTIQILKSLDTPVVTENQPFCVTTDPTVDDLTVTGENVVWYEDAALTTVAENTDLLIDSEDYYAVATSTDPNICSSAPVMVTVTIGEKPDAPVAETPQSFCLIDNPTVDDIVATGENVIIYEDEALTQEAAVTSPLANEAIYYAAATNNDCKSDAVIITITLSDGTAPTLQTEGNEFCRSDNPTVQDLIENLNGSGIQIYQASTGGTALATSTALVDGTTYFASGTDSTSQCESSERTAIQVEVSFCGIPEAFSPNGDNINDQFVIPDIAIDFPNYTIEIFNRWGNVVFKGNSSTGDWNGVSNQSGTLGDNVLAAGVYFYILNYNDGQTAPIQGKVYLSR